VKNHDDNKTHVTRKKVTTSLTLKYDIRQQVTKSLTLKYDIENFDNRVKHLAEHQIKLRQENEKMIYEIILSYGCKTTNEVFEILTIIYQKYNEKVRKEIQQKYEKGEFDIAKRDKLIEQKTVKPIAFRTVQNAIKNLKRKGKLVEEGKRSFRLKNPSDIERYKIINEISNSISKKIFQISNNDQDIIKHLINVIGTKIVFDFITIYGLKTDKSIKQIESDYLFIADKLNTTLQLEDMYEFFIKSIKSRIPNNSDKIQSKEDHIKTLLEEIGRLHPSIFGDLIPMMKMFESKKEV